MARQYVARLARSLLLLAIAISEAAQAKEADAGGAKDAFEFLHRQVGGIHAIGFREFLIGPPRPCESRMCNSTGHEPLALRNRELSRSMCSGPCSPSVIDRMTNRVISRTVCSIEITRLRTSPDSSPSVQPLP